jgi:hypothetical protein
VPLPDGSDGYLVDTPGLREIGMWGLPADSLDQCFPEFRPYLGECRFQDCQHDVEPECAVRAALAAKLLDAGDSSALFTLQSDRYLAEAANGIKASFVFRAGQTPTFSQVSFIFGLSGEEFFAKPVDEAEAGFLDKNGYFRFVYFGTIPFVYDGSGKSWISSELTEATVRIEVKMNAQGDKVEQITMAVIK